MEGVSVKLEAQPKGAAPLDQQAPVVASTAVKAEPTEAAVVHIAVKAEAMDTDDDDDAGTMQAERARLEAATEAQQPEVKQETTGEVKQEVASDESEAGDDVSNDEEEEEEEAEEGAWKQMLYYALGAAAPPSRFACSGRLESSAPFMCPDISVEGVGRLGMPLCKEQAATLKSVAEQAPHGKGLRTVVDTTVRDAFQVDASKVHIGNSWQPVLQSAVEDVARALDITHASSTTTNLEARLYKLLLYEQGGHFSAHQDTEKEKGMIGTLVVQLPCCDGHSGGSLVVRHKGVQYKHDFSQDSATSMQYVAFYADCEHELTPLTSGMRLVLTYNLVFTGPAAAAPRLVGKSPAEVQLKKVLRLWEKELAAGTRQKRIAFLLEHEYTESNLSFEHLKGSDRAMVRALSTCPGFDAHLVLVTRTVTGDTDSGCWGHKRRRYWCDDDDYSDDDEYRGKGQHTMVDVHEDLTDTGKWIAMDGSSINYGPIQPDRDFYDPRGEPLFGDDDEPDSENYEGYTGNAGPTLDQIYRRALLVIWPHSQALPNAKRAGLTALTAVLRLRLSEASDLQCSDHGENDDSSSTALTQHQQGSVAAGGQGNSRTSSTSSRGKKAAAEVVAALKACGEEVSKMLQDSGSSSDVHRYLTYGSSLSGSFQAAIVLKLGVQAVRLGIQGAVPPVLQLLSSACKSKSGLSDEKLAPALAAAACALGVSVVGPHLRELVIRDMPTQPKQCIMLIKRVVNKQELQNLLASAAVEAAPSTKVGYLVKIACVVPGLPAVQQAAVGKAAAAIQADTSARTAERVTGLLPRLQAMPALLQQLASVAAAALCASGPMQHCNSVAQLLQACQGQQQVIEQVVGSICNAASSSMVTWQVGDLMQLLQALEASPAARQAVLTAAMQGMFGCDSSNRISISSALLSSQTDNSLLLLSELLLSEPELAEAYYARFAAAVVARKDTYPLLQQLLQTESVRAALGSPAVQQLVACQVANLQRKSAVPPFSWHMKQAEVPNYPQVESFLQGPQESMFLRGFGGIAEARKAASQLLGRPTYGYHSVSFGPGSYASSTYSITAETQGTGKNAYVMIKKTRHCYELQVKSRQEFEKELMAVKALLHNVPVAAGRAAEVPAGAPVAA